MKNCMQRKSWGWGILGQAAKLYGEAVKVDHRIRSLKEQAQRKTKKNEHRTFYSDRPGTQC